MPFFMQEISADDIFEITTKAPCEAALMGERHVRIEISDFVMRTFVLRSRLDFKKNRAAVPIEGESCRTAKIG